MRSSPLCAMLCCALLACGYTDPGGGTRTLNVEAELSYHAADDQTHVALTVSKNTELLEGATVTLRPADSDQVFTIPAVQHPHHNYRGQIRGYHRRLELRIASQDDELHARIEGPSRFTIPEPEHNSVIELSRAGKELKIKWRPEDGMGSDTVRIWLQRADFDTTLTQDPGQHSVLTRFLRPGDETMRIERSNSVHLQGGTTGSTLSLSYRVSNQLVIE